MKISKIVSDGTSLGTKVYADNGELIDNVTAIDWNIKAGDISRVSITLFKVPVEITQKNIKKFTKSI